MDIKKYSLEGKVVYDPVTHSIIKIGDNDSLVTLAIPSSLCLLTLLQQQGEVVSHSELLAFAWESRGMMVSPNTLYQNMSILRKALVASGVSEEMIKTIPKRGFTIPASFPVECLYEASPAEAESDLVEDEKQPVPEVPPSASSSFPRSVAGAVRITPLLRKVLFAAACCAVFAIAYGVSNQLGEDSIPAYIAPEFVKIDSVEDCQVFRNYSLRSNDFFKRFISEKAVSCGKEKWWYLTNYPPSLEVSLLRCSKPLDALTKEKTSLCTSDFYSESGQ